MNKTIFTIKLVENNSSDLSLGKSRKRLLRTCLLALACGLALLSSNLHAGDQVSFDHTEFNFGQMRANNFASHTFWIYAKGSDTLVIDTVIPGCGCTSVPLISDTIAPGDSVAFEIVFNSKDLIGSVAKRPGFRLQGDTSTYNFKFYASIVTKEVQFFPLAIMPPIMNIQEAAARSGREFPFEIHNSSDEDIAIEMVDFPSELFSFDLPDSIAAEATITGHFKLLPGFPEGEDIYKSITFEANNSDLYRLTAPILMKSAKSSSRVSSPDAIPQADSIKQESRGGK